MRAAVVVMGDLGRSPRMNYHCLSLSRRPNAHVDFIGFSGLFPLFHLVTNSGTKCRNEILSSPNIKLHQMQARLPQVVENNFALRALYKVFAQAFWLLSVMFSIQKPDFVICQVLLSPIMF
jgi:beta-1,4-mannosyltransferase